MGISYLIMKKNKFISIVTYLGNSEKYIDQFLNTVIPILYENFSRLEFIAVDDGDSPELIKRIKDYLSKDYKDIVFTAVHMSGYQGLESAMNAGRDLAIGDFVYEFDDMIADYEPECLIKMYEVMISGYDIVAAGNGSSRGLSKLFYKFYNLTSRYNTAIGQETCRIITRRAINRVKSLGIYIPYRKGVYNSCGLKTSVIKYNSSDINLRKNYHKRLSERTGLAIDSFIYFTNGIEKLSMYVAGGFLFATIAMGIYSLCNYFAKTKPVEGWMSTMIFMSFGFCGVFALLTIILKYLSVLLNLVFKERHYIIEDIEKVDTDGSEA